MIVITTPTGRIGHPIVRELLDAGEQIRLVARNPDKLDPNICTRAEVIQGSIDDPRLLMQALDGAEALFWCVSESNTQQNVLDYYLRFANAAATAIQQTETPASWLYPVVVRDEPKMRVQSRPYMQWKMYLTLQAQQLDICAVVALWKTFYCRLNPLWVRECFSTRFLAISRSQWLQPATLG